MRRRRRRRRSSWIERERRASLGGKRNVNAWKCKLNPRKTGFLFSRFSPLNQLLQSAFRQLRIQKKSFEIFKAAEPFHIEFLWQNQNYLPEVRIALNSLGFDKNAASFLLSLA